MEYFSIAAELISCVISLIIHIWVLGTFFRPKHLTLRPAIYALWGLVYVPVSYFEIFSNLISSLIGMGICMLFACICFSGAWYKKCAAVFLINLFTVLISIAFFSILGSLALPNTEDPFARLIALFLQKMTCITVTYLLLKIPPRGNHLREDEFAILLFSYFSFFCLACFSFYIMHFLSFTKIGRFFVLLLDTLMFAVNIFLLFLIRRLDAQNQRENENRMLKSQLLRQEELLSKMEQNEENVRIIRHDMKSYLTNYLMLLENGETEKVQHLLHEMIHVKLSPVLTVYSKNNTVNTLLNETSRICKEKEIRCQIVTDPEHDIYPIELTVILANLINNAVEASVLEEVSSRNVQINMKPIQAYVSLIVRNKIAHSVFAVNPDLKSTKENPEDHGYGIKSVRKLVSEVGGLMDILEEDGYFTAHVMYPVIPLSRPKKRRGKR